MKDRIDQNNPEVIIREGFDRKDNTVPEVWFSPMVLGGEEKIMTDYYRQKALTREDTQFYLDAYFDERGWDSNKGIPGKDKLKELGLEWIGT